ncbi:hypothetical protein WDW37_16265 [Bdellovibrionota bacterium FG-1]
MRSRIKPLKGTIPMDDDEQALFDSIERGEWRQATSREEVLVRSQLEAAACDQTIKRTKEVRTNIRLNGADVEAIRILAEKQGVGYQTLMSSVLHQFATDQLVSRMALSDVARVVRESLMAATIPRRKTASGR